MVEYFEPPTTMSSGGRAIALNPVSAGIIE